MNHKILEQIKGGDAKLKGRGTKLIIIHYYRSEEGTKLIIKGGGLLPGWVKPLRTPPQY